MKKIIILFLFWKIGLVLEYINRRASLVGNRPVFDLEEFPWALELESKWMEIRSELDEVLASRETLPNLQDISDQFRSLSEDDRWKVYAMIIAGSRAEKNCLRCPRTTQRR